MEVARVTCGVNETDTNIDVFIGPLNEGYTVRTELPLRVNRKHFLNPLRYCATKIMQGYRRPCMY